MIVGRDSKQTDFIEVIVFKIQFHNFKIVYKRYQGLYFAVCIDINDNELLHLEVSLSYNSANPSLCLESGSILRQCLLARHRI